MPSQVFVDHTNSCIISLLGYPCPQILIMWVETPKRAYFSQNYNVHESCCSNALRLGTGDELFNFLADCVQDFVHELGMEDQEFSLGKYYLYHIVILLPTSYFLFVEQF